MAVDQRIIFYGDDSHTPTSRRVKGLDLVVAGIIAQHDRTNLHDHLVEIEQLTQKGRKDWFKTAPRVRERYIEAVRGLEMIRVFYCPFDARIKTEISKARIDTLSAAIKVFTTGHCEHRIAYEGLKSKPREQLRKALSGMGHARVSAISAQIKEDPEVRLADALAGYIRSELYRGGERMALTNLPDEFINLEPKIRNPPA